MVAGDGWLCLFGVTPGRLTNVLFLCLVSVSVQPVQVACVQFWLELIPSAVLFHVSVVIPESTDIP
jgi:hypothetical protein